MEKCYFLKSIIHFQISSFRVVHVHASATDYVVANNSNRMSHDMATNKSVLCLSFVNNQVLELLMGELGVMLGLISARTTAEVDLDLVSEDLLHKL